MVKQQVHHEFQIEMFKILATEGEECMLDLLNAIREEEIKRKDCEESLMGFALKPRGNVMECSNYRGIKLTEHVLRVFGGYQMKDCKDGETALWTHERKRDYGCHLYSKPTTGKEARGKPEALLCFCRLKRLFIEFQEKFFRMVMVLNKRTRMKVITAVWETETFEVTVESHQRSALVPFLFVWIISVLREEIRNKE
ncbi:uncharacterized protein [Palaemon carinicauda]|uniref:uncharacterized protein n=1 Tax=Palaemon carinicauda TaxID=392227 RepID=UPI0035B67152